jgi:hypothetical protein
LVRLEHVAIAGRKPKADASRSKAMSYARLRLGEERLRQEIEAYLDACDETGAAAVVSCGDDDRIEVAEHVRSRQARLWAIERATEQLEREAVERALREQGERQETALREGRSPRGRMIRSESVPGAREQQNFTEPESRIMKHLGAFIKAYNEQAAVDSEAQIAVPCDLTNQVPGGRPSRRAAPAGSVAAGRAQHRSASQEGGIG